MTQPTVIFFGPDGGPAGENKVFLRTLLYSTSRRGQMIESMHITVRRKESQQNFSIWVYGDKQMARGSGLFVGHEGIACNHHFLLPKDGVQFAFLAGDYHLRVFAKRVADREAKQLFEVKLHVTDAHATALQNREAGIYFDWGPDQSVYHAHVENRPAKKLSDLLFNEAHS